MTETVDDVEADLRKAVNDAAASVSFASGALVRFNRERAAIAPDPSNPDPQMFIGRGHPADPSSRVIAWWSRSEFLHQTAVNGPAHVLLMRQWIVALYALWEGEYRPRFALAANTPIERIKSDQFGDLRLIRNDIVHNGSIASAASTGRCRALTWFSAGGVIAPTSMHLVEFRDTLTVRVAST